VLRVLSSNCLWRTVSGIRLNASFSHHSLRPGRLAFVAQSGAMSG